LILGRADDTGGIEEGQSQRAQLRLQMTVLLSFSRRTEHQKWSEFVEKIFAADLIECGQGSGPARHDFLGCYPCLQLLDGFRVSEETQSRGGQWSWYSYRDNCLE